MALNSSIVMNPVPVWTPVGYLLPPLVYEPPPNRVSSTPAWLLLLLCLDYYLNMIKMNSKQNLIKICVDRKFDLNTK
jgi:hypothetical protein